MEKKHHRNIPKMIISHDVIQTEETLAYLFCSWQLIFQSMILPDNVICDNLMRKTSGAWENIS